MLALAIFLVLLLVIGALAFYAIDLAPIAQPFKNLLKIVVLLLVIIVLINRIAPGFR